MPQPQTYIISVSAGTGCYRHIAIPADQTLYQLHLAILDSFSFIDDHAHAFFLDNRSWSEARAYFAPMIADEPLHSTQLTLEQAELPVGASFKYIFDFGHEWIFQCKLLRTEEAPVYEATVIRSKGESPLQYPNLSARELPLPGFFPPIYSAGNLQLLAEQLELPVETQVLLQEYFTSAAYLYGILSLRQLLDLYNSQNDPIDETQFLYFAKLERHTDRPYAILSEVELYADGQLTDMLDWELISESLYNEGLQTYQTTKELQQGKPYYIPEQEEFLSYGQPNHLEDNLQSRALYQFLLDKVHGDENQASSILFLLQQEARKDALDFGVITTQLLQRGVILAGEADAQTFIGLQMELSNVSRNPVNRGHTPLELQKLAAQEVTEEPNPALPTSDAIDPDSDPEIMALKRQIMTMDLPDEQTRLQMLNELNSILGQPPVAVPSSVTRQKVGRNELCPCGSGKKYKRCCGA